MAARLIAPLAVSLVPTPHGDTRCILLCRPTEPFGLMMLGRGVGGGVTAHDLGLATELGLSSRSR